MSEPKVQPADQAQVASNPGETILYQAPGAETAPAYKPEEPMAAEQPAQGQQQQPAQGGEWSAGLCGCCSPFTSCLLACCAPCISMLLLFDFRYVVAWRGWSWRRSGRW